MSGHGTWCSSVDGDDLSKPGSRILKAISHPNDPMIQCWKPQLVQRTLLPCSPGFPREKRSCWSCWFHCLAARAGAAAPLRPQGQRQGKEEPQNTDLALQLAKTEIIQKSASKDKENPASHTCLPSLTYMSPQCCDIGSFLQFGSFKKSKKTMPLSHSAHSAPKQAHSSFLFLLQMFHLILLCDTNLMCQTCSPLQPRSLLFLRYLSYTSLQTLGKGHSSCSCCSSIQQHKALHRHSGGSLPSQQPQDRHSSPG